MLKVKEEKIIYSKLPEDASKYNEKMKRFYDLMALLYDVLMVLFPFWKKWIASVIPHIQGPKVLEVSFGPGYLLKQYVSHYDVWGIDYNQKMVEKTRKRLKGRVSAEKIIQGNVERLPYPDEFFDTIVNTMAFTAYPDGEKALHEMLRVLKAGGLLLLVDVDYPTDRNIFGYVLVKIGEYFGDIIKNIEQMLKQNGLNYMCKNVGGFGSVKLYIITK
jgi:ubiquinone/menaquinone biosynthesis C-methylase UbiE